MGSVQNTKAQVVTGAAASLAPKEVGREKKGIGREEGRKTGEGAGQGDGRR